MKVTYNWLKDYVDIDTTPYELADKLVSAGFEVEEIVNLSDSIKNVVTGKIVSRDKHPDADKLSVCQVDIGSKTLQIVCGADNANVGSIVPVALGGAVLPDNKVMGEGQIRGVMSYGMMCGGSELGLTSSDYPAAGYDGLFILDNDTELGIDINKIIGNDDYLMDISVTANRPDCNSIIGIAREISAILNKPFKEMKFDYRRVYDDVNKFVSVKVEACDLCPRYMAKVVKNIRVEMAPELIRRRLRAVGLRPINNIVDITNYVLIEIGQPMHAFDIRNIYDNEIIVRRAKEGESIVALDDKEYMLNNNHLVICDAERPIALGGIMGGSNSCVEDDTTTIVFESARFNRENIRRSSRELNLRTDSSSRFEKGVDCSTQNIAIERALTLLNMGDVVNDTIDANSCDMSSREIIFKAQDITSILGIDIDTETILRILNCLDIKSQVISNSIISTIPINREDIVGVNDLAEEVIRLYGYDHILSGNLPPRGGKTFEQRIIERIKNTMVSHSMNEIVTYSFTTPKAYDFLRLSEDNALRQAIKLKNPLGEDLSIMRTTLAHSMLSTIASNYNKGNREGRLFEVARVYIPKALPLEELPVEIEKLSIGIFGSSEDFYQLKAVVESLYDITGIKVNYVRSKLEYLHPGKSADIFYNGNVIGYFGEVHPDVKENYNIKCNTFIAELDIGSIVGNFIKVRPFVPIPKYPSIERDLALVMDDGVSVGEIIEYIESYNDIIRSVKLFDVYKGAQVEANKKSVALSIEMRDNERTLRIEETNAMINELLNELENKYNIILRL